MTEQSVLSGYGRSALSINQGYGQEECYDTKVTERSSESSDVDELKELEMRTGLVNKRVSRMRIPALKSSTNSPGVRPRMSRKKLTFAGDITLKSFDNVGGSTVGPSVVAENDINDRVD